jgi:hypothetical protein
MRRIKLELQSAVTGHRLCDVDEQGMGHRVSRVPEKHVDDSFGVLSSSTCVPQAEWCQAVGMYVLRCAFEFGERCNRAPTLVSQRMIGLE